MWQPGRMDAYQHCGFQFIIDPGEEGRLPRVTGSDSTAVCSPSGRRWLVARWCPPRCFPGTRRGQTAQQSVSVRRCDGFLFCEKGLQNRSDIGCPNAPVVVVRLVKIFIQDTPFLPHKVPKTETSEFVVAETPVHPNKHKTHSNAENPVTTTRQLKWQMTNDKNCKRKLHKFSCKKYT